MEPPSTTSSLTSTQRATLLYRISRQLLQALIALVLVVVVAVAITQWLALNGRGFKLSGLTSIMAFFIGLIGGYVSLQRRVKSFSDRDLSLVANSWVYTLLAPFVGGILALLALYIFVGGLLTGPLFPAFIPDPNYAGENGFISVLSITGTVSDYGRLVVWCFIAGFSESFVLNVLGQYEKEAVKRPTGDLEALSDDPDKKS